MFILLYLLGLCLANIQVWQQAPLKDLVNHCVTRTKPFPFWFSSNMYTTTGIYIINASPYGHVEYLDQETNWQGRCYIRNHNVIKDANWFDDGWTRAPNHWCKCTKI